jgi:hypothetical protein
VLSCRYEEDKFRKVDPPPKKKKGEESKAEDAGWESSNTKKKTAGKKAPAPLTFPGFSPKVADMLVQCHDAGIVGKGELDERVMEDLKALPERGTIRFAHLGGSIYLLYAGDSYFDALCGGMKDVLRFVYSVSEHSLCAGRATSLNGLGDRGNGAVSLID